MCTLIGVWISMDEALVVEVREPDDRRVRRLAREGRGSGSGEGIAEAPESFYFRVLDAIHHAHRILILGPDGAREGLRQRAESYAFMRERIAGVWREADGSPRSIATRLKELIGGGPGEARREPETAMLALAAAR